MSGIPGLETPATMFSTAATGPPSAQFLAALQAITPALYAQIQALQQVADAATGSLLAQIQLVPVTAPAAPASGFIIYVDSATGDLRAVSSLGTRTTLALP